jgi:hypothetical protein
MQDSSGQNPNVIGNKNYNFLYQRLFSFVLKSSSLG